LEVRDFALTVLRSEDLDVKLAPPAEELTDECPGGTGPAFPAFLAAGPGRPPGLWPAEGVQMPSIEGMPDPAQRPRILHGLANHELQAAELFAWALLAFPDTPPEFRRGLARILQDEQRHTRMYIARIEANGARFGDFPVNGYFWKKAETITTPLRFLCAMSLTFENANLDHTVEYAEAARRAGDLKTAKVIEQVEKDEIEHVRFGWTWLHVFKREDEPAWDAYRANLTWPLRPARARGRVFQRAGREAAGLDPEFIRLLEESEP
jgi:uncharacterized ferritin-like protein (DUF455 family)